MFLGKHGVLIAVLILVACSAERSTELHSSGSVMGTQFNVTIVVPDSESARTTPPDISVVFDAVDKVFSTYRTNSDLAVFNSHTSTEWLSTSLEFCTALEDSLSISRLTFGAFDASVGQLVNLWGFGSTGTRIAPPPDDAIRLALESTGYAKLHTRCAEQSVRKEHADLYVDLCGYAKGLAVDGVADLLDQHGYTDYLIELGGEIRVRGQNAGQQPWRIAVERPDDQQRAAQIAMRVSNTAIATSGDYRNFFDYGGARYSHTIDPRSGRPVEHATASVTVVAQSTAQADALATALLVMGHIDGLEYATTNNIAAYFVIRADNKFHTVATPAFKMHIEH